jgi:D-alanyl-D-alanine dipeptidase
MSTLKPYSTVPIHECGEPLVAIPRDAFAFFDPHPYVGLGAPYGLATPWMLRQTILASLLQAQRNLQKTKPGWRIMLFDAYRPITVQAFMVTRELTILAQTEGLNPATLNESDHKRLLNQAYRIFAIPSDDPATPPPHSTGAVFDCTLADENGREVDMGSPIDENSDRSLPHYFAKAADANGIRAHANRTMLFDVLCAEGFQRHPIEWWHFSRGDQLAVWSNRAIAPDAIAIYGRADLV